MSATEITQTVKDTNSSILNVLNNLRTFDEIKSTGMIERRLMDESYSSLQLEGEIDSWLDRIPRFSQRDIEIELKIPKTYQKIYDNYNFLKAVPQFEQRSEEWFAQREGMITASDGATALGESKYESQKSLLLKKCGEGGAFRDNKYVHHGKKYEPTATMIYEHIQNSHVEEFGLMPHSKYSYLGASPDGIVSEYTLNGKFNKKLGRMLEIKCPLSRKILTQGEVDGGICPHYYWVQVQQQMECCNCKTCDFWQCNIVEYMDREQYLADVDFESRHTIEQDQTIEIPRNIQSGCIIQLLPRDKYGQFCLYDAKFIYPPTLDFTRKEYDEWTASVIAGLRNNQYPELKDYMFHEVLYWKLPNSHNITIKRDKKWFRQKNPIYKKFWDDVMHYRTNTSDLQKIIEIRDKKRDQIRKTREENKRKREKELLDIKIDTSSF